MTAFDKFNLKVSLKFLLYDGLLLQQEKVMFIYFMIYMEIQIHVHDPQSIFFEQFATKILRKYTASPDLNQLPKLQKQ